MVVEISKHPEALDSTIRVVEHIETETGSERNPRMAFHYEARVYESREKEARELPRFRKTSALIATNEIRVNSKGEITEEGDFGEYDFFISAIFSGKYTKEELIKMVILRADANKRFD